MGRESVEYENSSSPPEQCVGMRDREQRHSRRGRKVWVNPKLTDHEL